MKTGHQIKESIHIEEALSNAIQVSKINLDTLVRRLSIHALSMAKNRQENDFKILLELTRELQRRFNKPDSN